MNTEHLTKSTRRPLTCGILTLAVALAFGIGSAQAQLTGSGQHLPGPFSIPDTVGLSLSVNIGPASGPFTGSWNGSTPLALSPWLGGTFSGTGPLHFGAAPTGVTTLNFAGMTAQILPTGSFIVLGDLDGGSLTNETFSVTAFDSAHVAISTPWLNSPVLTYGRGSGGGIPLPGDSPAWSWDNAGTYFFDGSTVVAGNPSVGVLLPTNQDVALLEITRTSTFANLYIAAPSVPEPSSMACVVWGVSVLGMLRRRTARL